mmetsp:Transcript_9257/g.13523  ORF Transcript_9257/g.13523 Transcript_9257/m.13523 type:complete len:96 (+) Transcript_9257:103-390(+)
MSAMVILFGPKLIPILFPKLGQKRSTNRSALGRGTVRVSGVTVNTPGDSYKSSSKTPNHRYSNHNANTTHSTTGSMSASTIRSERATIDDATTIS